MIDPTLMVDLSDSHYVIVLAPATVVLAIVGGVIAYFDRRKRK